MSSGPRHSVLAAGLLALAALFLARSSAAQGGVGITWVSLAGATTSGSGLTPTAASGHGESSQSIPSGNGSLSVAAWSSGDGNFVTFGLTNGTFIGDPAQIKYAWRSYGSVANCRLDGE